VAFPDRIDGPSRSLTRRPAADHPAGPAIEHFDGRFVVSNAEPEVAEGESPSRHLSMVEFPTIEHAKAWYDSPEYAEARALTPATFRGRVLMFVEGV